MLKALIVEDSHLFRRCLSEVLRTLFPDIRIVELAEGRQVLDQVQELNPDIVFMDIKLPDTSGLHLTRQIRAARAEIPIMIMTSYPQPEYRDAALAAGASHFFRKDDLDERVIETLLKSLAVA